MISYLEGRLHEKAPDHVILLAGGVGYKVAIPVSTYYELPDEGTDVSLRVHTHVREDTLALYGFLSALEERLFDRLISVAGVGPSLALKVMSGLEPERLIDSIRRGDRARLNAIPGVGRKTADRLILELREKMPDVMATRERAGAPPVESSMVDDISSALQNLGFAGPQPEKTARAVVEETPEISFEAALKEVLRRLSG